MKPKEFIETLKGEIENLELILKRDSISLRERGVYDLLKDYLDLFKKCRQVLQGEEARIRSLKKRIKEENANL